LPGLLCFTKEWQNFASFASYIADFRLTSHSRRTRRQLDGHVLKNGKMPENRLKISGAASACEVAAKANAASVRKKNSRWNVLGEA
jgi:hypothetical protein